MKKVLLAFAAAYLTGCSVKVDISLADTEIVQSIPLEYQQQDRNSFESVLAYNEKYPEGFQIIKFSAERNLQYFIDKYGMDHLYFRLISCETGREAFDGSAVYLDRNHAADGDRVYYSAYLPIKFRKYGVLSTSDMLSDDEIAKLNENNDLCMRLGAGSMTFATLKSNAMPIGLLKEEIR